MTKEIKKWTRNCPECDKKLTYVSKWGYDQQEKKNGLCKSCQQTGKRNHFYGKHHTKKDDGYLYENAGCSNCKNTFKSLKRNKNRKFCSVKCHNIFQTKRKDKKCDICGKVFNTLNKFCSKECKYKFYLEKRKKNCIYCKNIFYGYTKFCSRKCMGLSMVIPQKEKLCKLCNKEFINKQKKVKFCSHNCSVIYNLKYGNRTSIPERKAGEILDSLGVLYIHSYRIDKKVFDYYLPNKNLLVEIDGIYWHARCKDNLSNVQIKNLKNDKIKNKLAKEKGYKLIRVWEDELNELHEFFKEEKCI